MATTGTTGLNGTTAAAGAAARAAAGTATRGTAGTAARLGLTRREARMIAEELWKLMERERPKPVEEWLTVDEAADYLKCSKWKIYHDRERIPHEKRDGRLMFTREGLSRWIKREV